MKSPLLLASTAALALLLTGCTAASPEEASTKPPVIEHVHGIAADPHGGDDLYLATHNGIFTVSSNGIVAGPIGDYDFDAMGFTRTGTAFFASGHPGPTTPAELGAGNLGIIRSDDTGQNWVPVAFTGDEDFHVLTAGPDGTLYGIGSSRTNLLISTDAGKNWTEAPPIAAVDLVATPDGLYAATEAGLQISNNQGATFTPVDHAPLMYSIDARADGTLVGAGTDGTLWIQNADRIWEKLDTATGTVEALTAIGSDRIALVDERGVVIVTPDGSIVLSPKQD